MTHFLLLAALCLVGGVLFFIAIKTGLFHHMLRGTKLRYLTCPYCEEKIMPDAAVCKRCKRDLPTDMIQG
jgi:DNA-directed RNA polymerase subunit RPC12/RpoP